MEANEEVTAEVMEKDEEEKIQRESKEENEEVTADGGKDEEDNSESNLKYCLVGLSKRTTKKKVESLLTKASISFLKLTKVFGVTFARITFNSIEEVDFALKAIGSVEIEGHYGRLIPARKRPAAFENPDAKKQKTNDNEKRLETLSIEDVVTPLHKIDYDTQLKMKVQSSQAILSQVYQRIRQECKQQLPSWMQKGEKCKLQGIKGAPEGAREWYRNKSAFTIGRDINSNPCIGFSLGKTEDDVTAVADPAPCRNVSKAALAIRNIFQEFIGSSALPPYDKYKHSGFYRQLTVKTYTTGQNAAIFQVNPKGFTREQIEAEEKKLIECTKDANSKGVKIDSLVIQEWEGVSNAAPVDCPHRLLMGSLAVTEKLFDFQFRVSPGAFFQVNTPAAEVLYSVVCDWCKEKGVDTVIDICCGTGTIGLSASKVVKRVLGIELCAEAVEDAKENARINSIKNTRFLCGKAEEVLPNLLKEGDLTNAIAIVDPPRAGLHNKTIQSIRSCKAIKYLVYLSCDKGLVTNSPVLCKTASKTVKGPPFKPVKAVCVDLFPHTKHVETVVLFERDQN